MNSFQVTSFGFLQANIAKLSAGFARFRAGKECESERGLEPSDRSNGNSPPAPSEPLKSRNSFTIDSPCQFLGGKARKILLFVDFITPTLKIGGNRPEREAFVSTPRSASESAGQWQTRRRVRLPAGPSPQASSGGALMGGLRLGPTRSAGPLPTRLRRFSRPARRRGNRPAGSLPAVSLPAASLPAAPLLVASLPAASLPAAFFSAASLPAASLVAGDQR